METNKTYDNVKKPYHYNSGDIECIDAMIAAFGIEEVKSFCKINAFKYIWRATNKNGLEDMKKAVWYLNKYIELNKSKTSKKNETPITKTFKVGEFTPYDLLDFIIKGE